MLGPPKPRRLDQPIAMSLEDLVPAANFYRQLEATLDLGFVREWTRDLYAERGRPSIDPVVFFKLQLVMFFEGTRSERQLIEPTSLNPANGPRINSEGGEAFLTFLLDPATQDFIGSFGVEEFGEPLFTPCADNSCGVEAAPSSVPRPAMTPAA